MAAGEWEYIGTEQQPMQDTALYNGEDVYRIEAHRHRRPDGPYVRLRIYAVWRPAAHEFDALRVVVDGAETAAGQTVERFVAADSGLMRSVPFRRLFGQADADLSKRAETEAAAPAGAAPTDLPDMVKLRAEWPKGDTAEVARWAGRLYAAAAEERSPATKAVEDAFNVSRSTAKRMIALARELGFLAADVVGAPVPSRNRKGPTDHEQGTT